MEISVAGTWGVYLGICR